MSSPRVDLSTDSGGPSGWIPWVTLGSTAVVIFVVDMCIVHKKPSAPSLRHSALLSLFWILFGGATCGLVFGLYGSTFGFYYLEGMLLEYVLSVDNLIVFHFILTAFHTPKHLIYKPLFWGLMGAVLLRLLFFYIGHLILEAFHIAAMVLGLLLVITGITTLIADEDKEAHPESMFLVKLCSKICFIWPHFDEDGRFFVFKPRYQPLTRNPEEEGGAKERSNLKEEADDSLHLHATLLLLVLVSMEGTDIVFAVDSTAAKLALIPNLFLAFASTIVAMFGLRSIYFLLDFLIGHFKLLRYGLSIILICIGVKMAFHSVRPVNPYFFLIFVVGVMIASVVGSLIISSVDLRGKKARDRQKSEVKPLLGGGDLVEG